MLTRGDRQRLERLSAGVHRSVTIGHEIGLTARGRTKRIAERTAVTDRTVRRHCEIARQQRIHIPQAVPGRPPRTDYSNSRRGFRTSRQGRRGGAVRAPELSAVERAARSIARPGDDTGQIETLIGAIAELWPKARHPQMSELEAARALQMYREAGGRLGPEAERWWRSEVRRLPLDAAHTPWRAAASPVHLGPWLSRRRALERQALAERKADRSQQAYMASAERKTPEQLEAMRRAALGRIRDPVR